MFDLIFFNLFKNLFLIKKNSINLAFGKKSAGTTLKDFVLVLTINLINLKLT